MILGGRVLDSVQGAVESFSSFEMKVCTVLSKEFSSHVVSAT